MNKSDLIETIVERSNLPRKRAESVVNLIFDSMTNALVKDDRIEIRGFGSFSLRYRKPRIGRNPKSGMSVNINERYVPHFKPGKELRERVNNKYNPIS